MNSFGMWHSNDFRSSKEIDDALDNPSSTVETFLQLDDIPNEIRTNKKLMRFFKPEAISTLITYITTMPKDTDQDQLKYRFPFVAAEILKGDCKEIANLIFARNPEEEYKSESKFNNEDNDVIMEEIEPTKESPQQEIKEKEITPLLIPVVQEAKPSK